MHFYLGLPQAEIARLLGLRPRKVSYLWVAATDRLSQHLAGTEGRLLLSPAWLLETCHGKQ
jgi:DNA-directed RNA polymerase specialized sigma24 family protein